MLKERDFFQIWVFCKVLPLGGKAVSLIHKLIFKCKIYNFFFQHLTLNIVNFFSISSLHALDNSAISSLVHLKFYHESYLMVQTVVSQFSDAFVTKLTIVFLLFFCIPQFDFYLTPYVIPSPSKSHHDYQVLGFFCNSIFLVQSFQCCL